MTGYHVYSNGGSGPVNYAAPIATVSTLTYSTSALAYPSDTVYAVRAFDTVSGLEEQNVDARVRLVLDATGANVTARPNPPVNVWAAPTAGGGAVVHWSYNPAGQGAAPTGFKVWATVGSVVDYTAAPVSVPYTGPVGSATLSGLTDGVSYAIGVRAFSGSLVEPNTTAIASVTGDRTAPGDVDGLTVVATGTAG